MIKIGFFILTIVLLINSNECKSELNENERSDTNESSTVSSDSKECILNVECPEMEACVRKKCVNSCSLNVCGYNAECKVIRHIPICSCGDEYIGDPFIECIRRDGTSEPVKINTETAPPCGFFSSQRESDDGPICACLPGFLGTPPNCTPECRVNDDCAADKVCFSYKCTNICENTCTVNADCKIVNHATICSCKEGFEGDPYRGECKASQK